MGMHDSRWSQCVLWKEVVRILSSLHYKYIIQFVHEDNDHSLGAL
jgi:hypothetical protein